MNDTLYFEDINTVGYFHALQLPQDATDAEQEVLGTMIDFVHLYYGEPAPETGDPILSVFTLMILSGSAVLWLTLRRRTQYT